MTREKGVPSIKFVRLYGDKDGVTHLADCELPLRESNPDTGLLDMLTGAFPVKRAWLRRFERTESAPNKPRASVVRSLAM